MLISIKLNKLTFFLFELKKAFDYKFRVKKVILFVCEKDSKIMKILAPVRRQFDDLGIYSSQKFTLKSFFFFVSTLSSFALSTIFLFFEANTLTKYAESFYGAATALFIFSINVIHVWKKEYVFELMNITEDLIEKRKTISSRFMKSNI